MRQIKKSQILFLGFIAFLFASDAANAGDVSELRDSIKKAGQLLKDGKIVECAELVDACTTSMQERVNEASGKELNELKKLHSQLVKAHELLDVEGAELSELPKWDALLKAKKSSDATRKDGAKPNSKPTDKGPNAAPAGGVSFTKDIAPWMVEQCGRCHVNADRGGFSMASYSVLLKGSKAGVVLFPGDPVGSRLVETIETGDMPRGGGKVSAENLAKLKKWIQEGAKFDGPMPDAPIASLVAKGGAAATPAPMAEPIKIAEATGKETVSFARDLAPLLMANCNGCHYDGMRVQGGLNFNSFAGLIKGGTSGTAIVPTKPDESLLIKKLRGTAGARMPMGRTPLSDEQIDQFATWIKEGASFDGYSKEAKLDQIVGQAWAAKASHSELMQKRMERAREKWKLVAPKREASESNDDQVHVIGDIGPDNAKAIVVQANAAIHQIRKLFKISGKEPLIKGGFTIYAMKQRYDYSEFGTMIEKRSLPAEWSSHWRREVLDVYVAMVYDKAENKINETALVQQITSLWAASFDGVPKWFADGAGRQSLATLVGPNDARVQPWLRRLPVSMSELKNIKPLVDGSMNDEDSATIGFGIVRFMHEAKMRTQYEAIFKGLASGMNFEQATKKAIGPIDLFLQQVLGKKS